MNRPSDRRSLAALWTILLLACPQGGFNPLTNDDAPTSSMQESSSTVTPTTSEPATCGDGLVDEGEQCDEGVGNAQASYAPNKTCLQDCSGYAQYCGDGEPNGPEVCDEGENNSGAYSATKHCNQDCSGYAAHCGDETCQAQEACPADCMSVCGDGDLQAGEQCDGMGNTADCDADCTKPECGDEFVNPSFMNEQCDDKNMDNSDDCVEGCRDAVCGDGFLHAGVEQCDDNNQVDTDACSNMCVLPRRVFVTAGKFSADQIQGVAGADDICQAAAMAIPGLGTPGNGWLAWLSDDKSSPSTRVAPTNTTFAGYYLLPKDNIPVAQGWAGLTSGTLMNPINVTEGSAAASTPNGAWTNTLPDGTSGGVDDCGGWTNPDETQMSIFGSIKEMSEKWTVSTKSGCNAQFRLYCIEVSP